MKAQAKQVIALALTWDGARHPVKALPAKARAFLDAGAVPSRKKVAALLTDDSVREIRVCWVPRLKGGDDVLSDVFRTSDGRRIAFRAVRTTYFGEMLGVVYRR